MPPKSKAAPHSSAADSTAAVDEFMAGLAHPSKDVVQAFRTAILGISPDIAEGMKWHAPSFRTHEYFATTNFREKDGIGLVLHLGAKVRELGPESLKIEDPAHLLKWLAKDRASLRFADLQDFEAKKAAFVTIVRSWIRFV